MVENPSHIPPEVTKVTEPQETTPKNVLEKFKSVPIPRKTAILLAAWSVYNMQANIDYDWFGGVDRELQGALESEGIQHSRIRMIFGDHFMTDDTLQKVREMDTDVLTGEMPIDNTFFLNEAESVSPKKTTESLLESFVENTIPGIELGTEDSFFDPEVHSWDLQKQAFAEMSFCTTEGTMSHPLQNYDAMDEAVKTRRDFNQKVSYLITALALLTDAKAEGLLKIPMTRRDFLRIAWLGAGSLTLLGAVQVLNSVQWTLKEHDILSEANTETTGLYSKVNGLSDNAAEFINQLKNEKKSVLELSRLVKIRNLGMSINMWYLLNLLENNQELRSSINPEKSTLDVTAFMGNGHITTKSEFMKKPERISQELKWYAEWVINNYITDASADSEDSSAIIEFYTDICSSFSSPRLYNKEPLRYSASDTTPDLESAQTILYRTFMQKIEALEGNQKELLKKLFGSVLKLQLDIDIPKGDILGMAMLEKNDYSPKDELTLSRRITKSGVIPSNVNVINSAVEIYHTITKASYTKDEREVGILFLNGIPFPFFEKETIPSTLQ